MGLARMTSKMLRIKFFKNLAMYLTEKKRLQGRKKKKKKSKKGEKKEKQSSAPDKEPAISEDHGESSATVHADSSVGGKLSLSLGTPSVMT